MILTKEFDVKVYAHSNTATRKNIVNIPTPEALENLKLLHDNVLVPLMERLPGQFNITSGYRCDKLNAAVKGKPTSQHVSGKAADIEYLEDGVEKNNILYDELRTSDIEFDQCIGENPTKSGKFAWVHISYNKNKNRKQAFVLQA